MRNARRAKVLSFVISTMLILQCAMPTAAYAEEHKVQLSNHNATSTHSNTVSNIVVDGVDAPRAGTELDQTATVSMRPGQEPSWIRRPRCRPPRVQRGTFPFCGYATTCN